MDVEAVLRRARPDLLIQTRRGEPDTYLWEHSLRVANFCQRIALLPEIAARHPDRDALFAAALYHDAAYSIRCNSGEIDRLEALLSPNPDTANEMAATLLQRSLSEFLDTEALNRAVMAVRTRNDKAGATLEAQILSDADSLDEFGLVSLWGMIRRGALEGKGVQSALEVWKRKQEYQFWTARLNDSFRFSSVREIARRRLESFERFMIELGKEYRGDDLLPLTDSPEVSDPYLTRMVSSSPS